MGAPAARISRDEFLIPPEFAGQYPASHPAARVGGARIELITNGQETRLGTCYQQVPVRLAPPFAFTNEPASLLYLINLTAGLMDGDAHRIEVTARAGTKAVVTGQSATRVHPAVSTYATQQWDVTVEDDACLVVLPGPLIPYRGCRYFQRGRVALAPRARLMWGEIWFPGRYERGQLSEHFQFERIVQDFEARRDGRLVYRDRFCWDGPWSADEAKWYFGGEYCSASLFVAGPIPEPFPEADPVLRRSVMQLDTGVYCVRWCGPPAAVTDDLVLNALRLAGQWTNGPASHPWFLNSGCLAPNHWFSPLNEDAGLNSSVVAVNGSSAGPGPHGVSIAAAEAVAE